jgi:hypothetical protein
MEFAGSTNAAECSKSCMAGPSAKTPPPLPVTLGFTQDSSAARFSTVSRCFAFAPNSVFHQSNSMITLDYSILRIGDKPALLDYLRAILDELRAYEVRAEIDKSTDNINAKIQRTEQ